MDTVNDFLINNLDYNNWQFAFMTYDVDIPDKSLIWFKTSVICEELPRNIFFPKEGAFTVVVGIVPSNIMPRIGSMLDADSILRLTKLIAPKEIVAVGYGNMVMDMSLLDVNPDWQDTLGIGEADEKTKSHSNL